MKDKLDKSIRVPIDRATRRKVAKIADEMTKELPAGSGRVGMATVARIALERFIQSKTGVEAV